MWRLQRVSDTSENEKFDIKPGKPTTVGRKGTDIILADDASISRVHAQIEIKNTENSSESSGNAFETKCIISDQGSKYGTQINSGETRVNLTPRVPYNLKPNQVVQFGLDKHIYKIQYIQNIGFVTLSSGLNSKDKVELENIIPSIGGKIVQQYSKDCTHLTALPKTKMTQKLAMCLAAGHPIVTMEFWKSMQRALNENKPVPKARDFCPEFDDSMMQMDTLTLHPHSGRSKVFQKILFIFFMAKQLQIYEEMIKLAGGTAVYFQNKPISKKQFIEDNTILVNFDKNESQNEEYPAPSLESLEKFLKTANRRLIPDSEITLAILHCSTERSCNPKFKYSKLLKGDAEKKNLNSEVLALDTQDIKELISETQRVSIQNAVKKIVIPESMDIMSGDFSIKEKKSVENIQHEKKSKSTGKSESSNFTNRNSVEKDESISSVLKCPAGQRMQKNQTEENSSNILPESNTIISQNDSIDKENQSNKIYNQLSLSCISKKIKDAEMQVKNSIEYSIDLGNNYINQIVDEDPPENLEERISQKRKSARFDDNEESIPVIRKKKKISLKEMEELHPDSEEENSAWEKNQKKKPTNFHNNAEPTLDVRKKKQNSSKSMEQLYSEPDQQVNSIESDRLKRKSKIVEDDEELFVNPRKKMKESSFFSEIKTEKDDSTEFQNESLSDNVMQKKIKISDSLIDSINKINLRTVLSSITRSDQYVKINSQKLTPKQSGVKPIINWTAFPWKS